MSTVKAPLLLTLLCLALVQNIYANTKPESFNELPTDSRIWENRSGAEGSGYSDMQGPDVAFINNAWYYRNNTSWLLFHEGPTLNFNEVDSEYTEALQYEVFSGTAFSNDGTPGMYELVLEGATGNLITASGMNFNPQNMEKLKDANNATVYYNLENNTWWNITNLNNALTKVPPAPYKPMLIKSGTIPSPALFGSAPQNQLNFDIQSRRYLHINGGRVAAFHNSIANNYRRWNNNSGVEGSGYSDMSGPDIIYINGIWYAVEDETHYRSFFEGRYLEFANSDTSITEALQYELIVGTSLENEGSPSDLDLKLDGETGKLLNSSGVPLLTSDGEDSVPTVLFSETLVLQGINTKNANNTDFNPVYTQVKLLRVVPLRNSTNDPFNDRTLPTTIASAQNPGTIVITPPTTPPPSGSCPLNTSLFVLTSLPSGLPLGQSINLSTTQPFQLQTGLGPTNAIINIAIVNQGNSTQAIVTLGSGFTFVSGSSVGTITEGSNLNYLLRRMSDNAVFEVNVNFTVDMVFDDMGIIIQTLSGRYCQSGAPL